MFSAGMSRVVNSACLRRNASIFNKGVVTFQSNQIKSNQINFINEGKRITVKTDDPAALLIINTKLWYQNMIYTIS